MENILGEEVEPRKLTFKYSHPHLEVYANGKFLDFVNPNGWTGKYMCVNYQIGEPIINNPHVWGTISLGEMQQVINTWNHYANVEGKN